jgi:hypothetical protein
MQLAKFFEDVFPFAIQAGRGQNFEFQAEVSATLATNSSSTEPFESDDIAMLSTGLGFNLHGAIERLNLDLETKCCIRDRNLELSHQVITIPPENRVRSNRNLQVNISRGATGKTNFPLTRQVKPHAIGNTGRDVEI